MENINDQLEPQLRRHHLHILMTSNESVHEDEFSKTMSSCNERYKLAKMLTSDSDFFVEIATDRIGSSRIKILLLLSDEDVKTILYYKIISKFTFTKIMTHENGYDLGLLLLKICNNIQQKRIFCHITYRNSLVLASNEYGCIIIKKVITIADDLLKHEFLDLIAHMAFLLSKEELGISLIQHMLKLDITQKTTQDHTRLHGLMGEFDEILSTSCDTAELHKCALKLTSDSDLFIEFIKTSRGSLTAQIILGKSEEIDTVFLEAIKQRFTDVTTYLLSYRVLLSVMNVFKKRGNVEACDKILRLIGVHALRLTKDPCVGYRVVLGAIDLNDFECTNLIAHNLENHYIDLSFIQNVSEVVEKLVENRKTVFPLHYMVKEIVKSDEDTLVRLARDEWGSKVLIKTIKVANERRYKVLVDDLVDKLKPIFDRLLRSGRVNIAPISDPETKRVKDQIESQGNN